MLKFARHCVLLAIGLSGAAVAVEPTVFELDEGGAVAPHLALEFGTDNNPLRADEGSEASAFLRFQPSLEYLVRRRNNRLTLGYFGDFYQYFSDYCQDTGVSRPGDCLDGSSGSDRASYQDHRVRLNGFLEITSRVRASLLLSQSVEHQPLGTGQSVNLGVLNDLTTPDDWLRRVATAQVSYGANQAKGELRAGISLIDRELRSERDVNLDAQSDNSVAPFVTLLYRVGTRTQLFAGLRHDRVRDGVVRNRAGTVIESLERDITALSFGAELDANSVTSGSVSISTVQEDFVEDDRDLSYLAWDINLVWKPRTFSTVTFSGGRETETGLFDDDIALTTTFGVRWEHFWRDRLSSQVVLDFEVNDDQDEDDVNEFTDDDDSTTRLRFGLDYNVRRWFDIGGFVEIDTRDGRADVRDFQRTVIGITANGTI